VKRVLVITNENANISPTYFCCKYQIVNLKVVEIRAFIVPGVLKVLWTVW